MNDERDNPYEAPDSGRPETRKAESPLTLRTVLLGAMLVTILRAGLYVAVISWMTWRMSSLID
jgi:hypothetical protein